MVRGFVPREFVWTAPVWQADVDAFGEVRNASLVRLLQEAATRASSDVGFDAHYYERTGTMWLIRRTTLTLATPARYGDVLTVRTWIADFRRVRSQRQYTVHTDNRLVAHASSDWVFVDRATNRPRRIPHEWQATFMADDDSSLVRTPFPEQDPPAEARQRERRIELHELDALRHVNNSNYVSYIEQATLDTLDALGWSLDTQLAAGGRLRPVYHDLEYLDAALYGERVTLTVWPSALTTHHLEHHIHMHRGDVRRPLLQARSRYAWTTADGEVVMPPLLRGAIDVP